MSHWNNNKSTKSQQTKYATGTMLSNLNDLFMMEDLFNPDSTAGHQVPTLDLRWDLEEEDRLLLEDAFLGSSSTPRCSSPATPRAVFVEADGQGIPNGGFFNNTSAPHQPHQNMQFNNPSFTPTHQHHQSSAHVNSWLDEYMNLDDAFGSSSKSLPTNTGANFPTHGINSFGPNTDYESYHSNSFSNFHQPSHSNDHRIQELSGPSTSSNNISTTAQFSQLHIQEGSLGADNVVHPPIPESEYSASFSPPGSNYSSDWSTDHSSAQSQDEILEEIRRECIEIEHKSVSPPLRQKTYKRRSNTIVKRPSSEKIASASSSNSLSGGNSDRKKELNRIAATKYREKKRLEKEMLGGEHVRLESRNHELKSTVKELKTEVAYLKKLMKDMESRARQT